MHKRPFTTDEDHEKKRKAKKENEASEDVEGALVRKARCQAPHTDERWEM